MTQDELKTLVARAALEHVVRDDWIGVGTGSTVDKFIDELATVKSQVRGAVSSSERSTQRLRAHGIRVVQPHEVTSLPVYIDGADEIDARGFMIKGGGAALTREKIVADLARRFVCIADASKLVDTLGAFPLPVEVIELAAVQLMRRFEQAFGARATVRPGVLTDNGHPIIDVRGLRIDDPLSMERELNQWPGVVCCGIFARHKASTLLLGTPDGVKRFDFDGCDPGGARAVSTGAPA
jgi:ribose 5-phosphate isomerase A